MKIEYLEELGKFAIRTNPMAMTDVENARFIPNRKFDKTSGLWIAGPTRANVAYLTRWKSDMSDRAKVACDQIMTGVAIKKGSPPPGFQFKTDPYPHQLECFLRCIEDDGYALLMDPGTGKTKVAIDDQTVQFLRKKVNAVVVICPNSIKSNWRDEIGIHSSTDNEIFEWEPELRKQFERFTMTAMPGVLKWVIIGVESFSQGTAYVAIERFLNLHRASILEDESSRIKNHDADRTKRILDLRPLSMFRRIMSGTPFSKGIHQMWSQYEFLDPNILDMGYYAFRNKFCIMGGYKGKQIVGTMNEDQFIDLVAPHTFRASKAECLKLPPKVHQVRKVKPTDEQRRIYENLKKEGAAEANGGMVSYTNTLVRDLRLQQVTGGFVAVFREPLDMVQNLENIEEYIAKAMKKAVCEPIPGPNPKIQELLDVAEETPGKMIVWTRFKPEIEIIVSSLRKKYGKESVVEFHGDISNDDRATARRRFQSDPECLYFVGQVSTGGIGITLTAAPTVVYISNAWPLEDRIQSEDRAHRIGQTADEVLYIDIVMDASWVDDKIRKALADGKNYTDVVMNQIEAATSGIVST